MNASRIVVGTLGALAISTSAQAAAAPHATIAIHSLDGQVVKVVRWRMGDPRVRLTVSYDATLRRTSAFGASVPHAVAALNGDFFTWGRHRPAGLTIVSRRMYSAGWQGAPTAGYAPGGRVVFGLVQALPIGVYLNHRRYGVVLNRRVVAPGTLIVYNRPGTRVVVPRGWYSVVAHSAFDQTVVPARGVPRALALHHPGSEMPVERVAVTATRARRVPFRSALLLVRRHTAAYRDLTAVMHRESPGILANVADARWAAVSSTIGGKPYLVLNGRPIRERPSYVELGSWTCRCMRSAVATFENGSAGLVEIRSGDDLQAARTLKAMGVVTAMGFDSGGSADLWTAGGRGGCTWGQRGRCFTANPGGERLIPDATVLSVH